MRRLTLAAVFGFAAVVSGQPRPDDAAVKAKLTGHWREISSELPREKQLDPNGGLTWDLFTRLTPAGPATAGFQTDWDNEAQQWVGELTLNAKADPMWLDFRFKDAGRDRVKVGIIRFEGKNARWVRTWGTDAVKYDAARGDVPERPRSFTDPKGNPIGYVLEPIKSPAARAEKLVLVAGGGKADDPVATKSLLVQPFGVDFGADGTAFIVEMAKGERLRSLTPDGKLTTLAGTLGKKGHSGDGGPGERATFNGMHSLAVGPDGRVFLADTWNNCVRTFDPKTGTVAAFAGTGEKGFSGDGGPALKAKFGGCFCVSFDPAGTACYVTDLDNRRIRKIDVKTGVVSTVAGNGERGVPKDGEPAASQPLVDPRAHAVDRAGNLYILERGGHALRVVSPDGRIRTVAGTGRAGSGVGAALAAAMNGPKHLCIDRDGSVLIADTENHRIVRYLPAKRELELVAGTGRRGTAGVGGDPRAAEFNQPHGVIVHPRTGELYISDASNGRVLKIVRE
ncbi:NHL repeat-containing protein [Urbifossiella limnaea]|uniref:NHL repeat protein n=1 Tax=Urbifossiella limnaea TaxID=2528023 RepID=A0A517XRZ4_9BACT|nr:hypothetical protein [Urbifossiella limnaea]QDU20242.1 NHL repeat protein [Urbifossiella limnaea]